MKKLLVFPYTFVLLNWAALVACYYFITNRKDIWVKIPIAPLQNNEILKKSVSAPESASLSPANSLITS